MDLKAVEILIREADLEDLDLKEKEAFKRLEHNTTMREEKQFPEMIEKKTKEIEQINSCLKRLKEARFHLLKGVGKAVVQLGTTTDR